MGLTASSWTVRGSLRNCRTPTLVRRAMRRRLTAVALAVQHVALKKTASPVAPRPPPSLRLRRGACKGVLEGPPVVRAAGNPHALLRAPQEMDLYKFNTLLNRTGKAWLIESECAGALLERTVLPSPPMPS